MSIARFAIADLIVEMKTEYPMKITASFQPFLEERQDTSEKEKAVYRAQFQKVNCLPEPQGEPIAATRSFFVYDNGRGSYVRRYLDEESGQIYACSWFEPDKRRIQVKYLLEGRRFLCESGNSFFHIEWESLLLNEHRIMLHAACVNTEVGGILFSGASGAGKSTQAELWRRYEMARIINGDRTILGKRDSAWTAYGSPYAGSSRCYVNEGCRVRAIVFVKKAQQCSIRRLEKKEAFRKIYRNLTVNSWDISFVNCVCDLTMEMISEIPVYEMECTREKQAVITLRRELERRDG